MTLVDDSGLTAVDVAKTKKVKATLKQAWTEATQAREVTNLGPVREGSSKAAGKASPKKSARGCGEVIFDVSVST